LRVPSAVGAVPHAERQRRCAERSCSSSALGHRGRVASHRPRTQTVTSTISSRRRTARCGAGQRPPDGQPTTRPHRHVVPGGARPGRRRCDHHDRFEREGTFQG
jgi:hypothetical protein